MLAAASAGEIYVEVKDEAGNPKEGAKVQVAMADGEETVPVKTNKEGVAFLAWKTDMKRGRILVDGSAQYAGTIPLRISFKLWGKPEKE
jgi:hypothetical protein